jgi:hypothetical protein
MSAPFRLAVALAIPLSCGAQPAALAPWVTGEILLKKLQPVDPRRVPWSPKSNVSREEQAAMHTNTNVQFARGYVAALHDATEGKVWCFNPKNQTPNDEDFWDASRWGLAQLPAKQLPHNAADLLPAIWRVKWPCPDEHRRKP